jgi:hypothetical protein
MREDQVRALQTTIGHNTEVLKDILAFMEQYRRDKEEEKKDSGLWSGVLWSAALAAVADGQKEYRKRKAKLDEAKAEREARWRGEEYKSNEDGAKDEKAKKNATTEDFVSMLTKTLVGSFFSAESYGATTSATTATAAMEEQSDDESESDGASDVEDYEDKYDASIRREFA